MNIINADYKFITEHQNEPMKFIEQIGRTCYKSEDKITDLSAPKFIDMLVSRQHLAMVEHFIFIAKVSQDIYDSLIYGTPKFINFSNQDNGAVISFSARSILDMQLECTDSEVQDILQKIAQSTVYRYNCPELFGIENNGSYSTEITFVSNEEAMETFNVWERLEHCWFSVRWTCDRGVSHELVRHRVLSFAQESTRYCNYSHSKFGNELTFIHPCFWDSNSMQYDEWLDSMLEAEKRYFNLLNLGASPQEARDVLPNSLKTEVCMTGRLKNWHNFFVLRTDKPAHPQMRELAVPMLIETRNKFKTVFDDIKFN